MFQRFLAGFMVMAVALTGAPIIASAGVEVGDNLKLFGDFRLRLEFDDRDPASGSGGDKRERPRYRLRFGAKYQTAIEPLSFGFRLATGSSFNSPHNNLETAAVSGTGSTDGFGVDRAYAKLKFLESGALIVGKQGYSFWQQTEQFWDEDIQPEGYAAAYTASLGDAGSLTAALAYYYITNTGWQSDFFENDTATVWQIAYKGNFGGMKAVLAGTGLHTNDGNSSGDWAGVGSMLTTGSCAGGVCAGGVTNDPAFYMISAQLKGSANDFKWRAGFDYHLSDADVAGVSDDHDTGYVAQVRAGMGSLGVRYYYYDIEELSVPSYAGTYLSQDNGPSGNSAPVGFEGHRIQLDYKIAKGVSADFRVYLFEGKSDSYSYGETANDERNRYQLNFNVKF